MFKMQLPFTYLDCQSCTEIVHCDHCERLLTDAINSLQGIQSAFVQMPIKRLYLETSLDADAVEACLEELGVFVK